MASIAASTAAACLTLRAELVKSEKFLQQYAQGTQSPATATAAYTAAVDAQLATLKTALIAVTGA